MIRMILKKYLWSQRHISWALLFSTVRTMKLWLCCTKFFIAILEIEFYWFCSNQHFQVSFSVSEVDFHLWTLTFWGFWILIWHRLNRSLSLFSAVSGCTLSAKCLNRPISRRHVWILKFKIHFCIVHFRYVRIFPYGFGILSYPKSYFNFKLSWQLTNWLQFLRSNTIGFLRRRILEQDHYDFSIKSSFRKWYVDFRFSLIGCTEE